MEIKLTVYFESPFWVGVFEKYNLDQYQVAKIVFGSEPKDYEVYDYILRKYKSVIFSEPLSNLKSVQQKINPKRLQRMISKELQRTSIGTKAQQALKLEHEKRKKARKQNSKLQKEERKKQIFELKQQKRKEKKKGH